ncbi:MAG: OmpH family outer membrane protein [Proteobacteria bacterium]|nr:OmpH family outer membrane protein [Pseudomonadota bacterium]
MKIGWLVCVFVVVGLSSTTIAQAQKIVIIDTQRVITESIIGKAAKNNLEVEIKKGQAKVAALKADFERQRSDLEKQSAILSGSALESRREELERKQVEFQRIFQDIQEKLARSNDAEISKVVSQINELVKALAQEKEYQFVFERDRKSVLFSSERIDITDEVVKSLDKKRVAL